MPGDRRPVTMSCDVCATGAYLRGWALSLFMFFVGTERVVPSTHAIPAYAMMNMMMVVVVVLVAVVVMTMVMMMTATR